MRHAQDETEKTNEAKGKPFASLRAENETRTRDLRITNASLYQLSYFGNANLSIAVQKYAFLPTLPNYPPIIFRKRGILLAFPTKSDRDNARRMVAVACFVRAAALLAVHLFVGFLRSLGGCFFLRGLLGRRCLLGSGFLGGRLLCRLLCFGRRGGFLGGT